MERIEPCNGFCWIGGFKNAAMDGIRWMKFQYTALYKLNTMLILIYIFNLVYNSFHSYKLFYLFFLLKFEIFLVAIWNFFGCNLIFCYETIPGSWYLKFLARWHSCKGRYLVSALCGKRMAGGAPDKKPLCNSQPTSDIILAFRKYGVTSRRYLTVEEIITIKFGNKYLTSRSKYKKICLIIKVLLRFMEIIKKGTDKLN